MRTSSALALRRSSGARLCFLLALGHLGLQGLGLGRVHLAEGGGALLLGELHVELVELDLVLLPLAVVVDPHHEREGEERAMEVSAKTTLRSSCARPSPDRDRRLQAT
jgi:hypothetical protein